MKAIGVDLGGTNLRAAIVDTATQLGVLEDERKVLLPGTGPEQVVEILVREATELSGDGPPMPIGIGIAAMLKGDSGIVVNSPNLGWRDVDLRGMLERRLPGHRIVIANDVQAIAYGEYRFGAGAGAQHLLCIYAGTGIGGGIIAGGRLLTGASGMTGEIGHSKVVWGPGARLCGCGQRGCIEAYASGKNLAARMREELAAGERSLAVELAGGDPTKVHAGHLDDAAERGDAYALRLYAEIAPLFGQVVANAVTLLNPQRVIFGGGVLWGAPVLRGLVLDAYRSLVNAPSGKACEIVEAKLGEAAGILGAASLAVHL
jgi:glucokinase